MERRTISAGQPSVSHAREVVFAVVLAMSLAAFVGPLLAAESPYLYGIHDHEPRPTEFLEHVKNSVPGGWVTATVAIGHDPNDTSGGDFSWFANEGHTVICRLNNGYFPNGTIPLPAQYDDFARRCANYVQNSTGCDIWVIGNETNIAGEWPASGGHLAYVSPTQYAECFRKVYNAIKGVRPGCKVMPQALAPFSGPFGFGYTGGYSHDANPLSWVDYSNAMYTAIRNSGPLDGIALHVTSHGYALDLITSLYQRSISGKNLFWYFQCYRDWFHYGMPWDLWYLPAYITECNGYYWWKGGSPEDESQHYVAGWIQEVFREIDMYNRTIAVPQGQPIIRCINFYRWCASCDGWNIDGDNPYKSQIMADLDAALALRYTWPGSKPIPDEWSDDFNDGSLDSAAPEPYWHTSTSQGGGIQETEGWLRLTGTTGSASAAEIKDSDYKIYDNFLIATKLCLTDPSATSTGESSAEIGFRTSPTGVGYGLAFVTSTNPGTICLRRTDTGAVIQGAQISYPMPGGTTMYISIRCDANRIRIQIGSAEGESDVAAWQLVDETFRNKGYFRLANHGMRDARFDYFNYESLPPALQGVVRDSLGNPVSGAKVVTNIGGHTVYTNSNGAYEITGIAAGAYDVTASKTNYKSQLVSGVSVTVGSTLQDFTITDSTRPTTPVVADDGTYQTSSDSIHFTWSASDPESGIGEYRYAVSKTLSIIDIIPGGDWLPVGAATGHTRTGLSLINGQTYYGLVKAINPLGIASLTGMSNGIKIAKPEPSIGRAKANPDNTLVALNSVVVSAALPDCTYVEDTGRSGGIKLTTINIAEGALLNIAGVLSTANGERQISAYSVAELSRGAAPEPLGIGNKALGGLQFSAYTPGVNGGKGLNNIGLLVTIWGVVSQPTASDFLVEDGSRIKVKVLVPTGVSVPADGAGVSVTGVSTVDNSTGIPQRQLRVRKSSDIAVID